MRRLQHPIYIVVVIGMHNWEETGLGKFGGICWEFEELSVSHGVFFHWKDVFEAIGQVEVVFGRDHVEEVVCSFYYAPEDNAAWQFWDWKYFFVDDVDVVIASFFYLHSFDFIKSNFLFFYFHKAVFFL